MLNAHEVHAAARTAHSSTSEKCSVGVGSAVWQVASLDPKLASLQASLSTSPHPHFETSRRCSEQAAYRALLAAPAAPEYAREGIVVCVTHGAALRLTHRNSGADDTPVVNLLELQSL